jgi:hypothetical protein
MCELGTKALSDWQNGFSPMGMDSADGHPRGALTARPGLVLQGRYVALRKLTMPTTTESYQQLA